MHPSRPSPTVPNAPYRAAIAALGGNFVNEQEVDQTQPEPGLYQQNAHEELAPRRNTNRDRLNQIAHRLGSGVRVALELMTPEQAHPENVAGPSNAGVASTQLAVDPHTTVRDIQQYLSRIGYRDGGVADQTIRIRLDSANISAATILSALQTLQDPSHPLLVRLGVMNNARNKLIKRLTGVVNSLHGFRPEIRSAIQRANNNPDQLIINLLTYTQR